MATAPAAKERISALAAWIEERERAVHPFDLDGFFSLGGKPVPRVAVRVSIKTEDEDAIVAAHRHVQTKAAGVDAAKADDELVRDAKVIEILWRVCRDVDDPRYPAFPGPQWMRDHLTTDQLSVLFHLAMTVRRKEGPPPHDDGDAGLDEIVRMCAAAGHTAVPEAVLAGISREHAVQLVIGLALKLHEERGASAAGEVPAVDVDEAPPSADEG